MNPNKGVVSNCYDIYTNADYGTVLDKFWEKVHEYAMKGNVLVFGLEYDDATMKSLLPMGFDVVEVKTATEAKNAYLGASGMTQSILFISMDFHVGLDLRF